MFPTAFALTPHGQTGALAQQVQTRYLSIIIVADNGDALDAWNYRKNETGIIQSQLRHVRSRGASLCAPAPCAKKRYLGLCIPKENAGQESRGDRSLLIDVEILNAHRALVARRLVTFMTLSRSLNAARRKKNRCLEESVINARRLARVTANAIVSPSFRVCTFLRQKIR